jgi:hypothetical protein
MMAEQRLIIFFFFYHGAKALVGQGFLIIEVSRSHSDTPHSVGLLRTSDKPDARPLPNNTQYSQETNIRAAGGIRTHSPSNRAAADPRLRLRGHWDQHIKVFNIN